MRAIWKGHISFGLINIPVNLYAAEQRSDLTFHMIDSRDYARVRYERVNAETGEEVPWDQVVKGYEYDDGNYVVLKEEELKKVAPKATQTIELESFVSLADIDVVYFDKPYYLEPGKNGAKGYALLREVLRESGKAGIGRVVIRTRQYVAALVPRGEALVLDLLRYPQELRSTEELTLPGKAEAAGVKKQELKMAQTLVESLVVKWDPAQYEDEFRTKLLEWIEQKALTGKVHRAPESAAEDLEAPRTINLLDALKKSLAQAPAGRRAPRSKSPPKRARTTKKVSRKKAG